MTAFDELRNSLGSLCNPERGAPLGPTGDARIFSHALRSSTLEIELNGQLNLAWPLRRITDLAEAGIV